MGEEGPELFVPGVSGTVLNADDTRDYVDGPSRAVSDQEEDVVEGQNRESRSYVTNIDARRNESRDYVEGSKISQSPAEDAESEISKTEREMAMFRDTRQMINSATSVMREKQGLQSSERVVEAMAATETKVEYSGTVLRFNDEDYIRKTDVDGIVRQASKRGKELVASGMKRDPSFRRQLR